MLGNRISIALLALGICLLGLVDMAYRERLHHMRADHLENTSKRIAQTIGFSMELRIVAVRDLRALMMASPDFPTWDVFDQYCAIVMEHYPSIRGFAYVDTESKIRHFYPLKGNEKAMGLDLMARDGVYVQKTIDSRKMTLNQPLVIAQGALSVIARDPMYRGEDYLGMVEGVFDIRNLLNDILLPQPERSLSLQLMDSDGKTFWGHELGPKAIETRVPMGGEGHWILRSEWDDEPTFYNYGLLFIWGLGGGLVVSLVALFSRHWDRTERLGQMVEQRTRELKSQKDQLETEVEERKSTEQALRKSRAFAEQILDSLPLGLTVLDAQGVHIHANQAAQKILGFSLEELRGSGPPHLYWPEEERETITRAFETMTDGNFSQIELTFKRKNQERFPVQIHPAMIQNLDGEINYFATILDLSKQKSLEAQLHRAQKMEAIGRVAGGVAHDFNNLLTAILGATELALGNELEDSVRQDLETIRDTSEAAGRLTKQLLAISKRSVVKKVPLCLNEVLSDMVKLFDRILGEDVHCSLKLAPKLPAVLADRAQLEQTILNLVVNAREAMPDGGDLELSTAYLSEAGEVTLVVTDSGVGLDPNKSERLFEPFYSTKPGSSGLGLSTCFAVVTSLGGSLTVESEPGNGATFHIRLPESKRARPQLDEEVPKELSVYQGQESILVVEDQPAIRRLLARSLGGLGYRVTCVASAEEALALAQEEWEGFDLLLTDVLLPGQRGTELADVVMAKYPGLRVAFMSGYVDGAAFPTQNSEVNILSKPFSNCELVELVRTTLDAQVE